MLWGQFRRCFDDTLNYPKLNMASFSQAHLAHYKHWVTMMMMQRLVTIMMTTMMIMTMVIIKTMIMMMMMMTSAFLSTNHRWRMLETPWSLSLAKDFFVGTQSNLSHSNPPRATRCYMHLRKYFLLKRLSWVIWRSIKSKQGIASVLKLCRVS